MIDQNDCSLLVAGQVYGGWTRLEVQRSMEHVDGGFVLQLTRRWPGQDDPVYLREGLACEVRLGEDTVITGYIDDFDTDDTDTTTSLSIHGRDKTGDLVDCSAVFKTGQWRNVRLEQIVHDLAAPFGIQVVVATNTGEVFKHFALEDGEKAFDAIDRACRLRAVLVTSTPSGNLVLTHASTVHTGVALIEGVNMQKFSSKHSWRERFQTITMKAQGPGDDHESGAAVAHLKALATDPEIDRYRPLIVVAEHGTSAKALQDRAVWERQVRMGRGKRGQCTVVGWRTGLDGQQGPLWQPNTLVRVTSARMQVDMDLLIVACSYQMTEQGCVTELTFARREAFVLVPGVGASHLNAKLNDKTQKEKKKRDDGFTPSWDLTPPNPRSNK